MTTFKAGKEYYGRFTCSSETIDTIKVIRRTAKTAWVINDRTEKKMKIHNYDGVEFVYPHGRYSMAMVIKASRERVLEAV